jgi:hypothetical protein
MLLIKKEKEICYCQNKRNYMNKYKKLQLLLIYIRTKKFLFYLFGATTS